MEFKETTKDFNENFYPISELKKIFFNIIKKWYIFIITILIFVSFYYIKHRYSNVIYKVSGYILIKDKETSVFGGIESILEEQGIIRRVKKRIIENEIAILKSYSLVEKTLSQLPDFLISYYLIGDIKISELYKNSPFTVIVDTNKKNLKGVPIYVKYLNENEFLLDIKPDKVYKKRFKFGKWYYSPNFSFCILNNLNKEQIAKNLDKTYYFIINDIHQLIKTYRSKINISLFQSKSSVLEVSSNGEVPAKEADFINKLLDTYNYLNLAEKNQIAENTIYFVDNQLEIISDSLQTTEALVKGFRQSNYLIDLSHEANLLYSRLSEVQKQYVDLLMKKKYLEYLKEYLNSKTDYDKIISPSFANINDNSLNELLNQLIKLNQQLSNYKTFSTEKNPLVGSTVKEIDYIRQLLIENINNQLTIIQIGLDEVNKNLEIIKESFKKVPDAELKFINLQRRFKLNDQIYTYLLTKRAEASIAKASNVPDNKIIDYAKADNAVIISPKYTLNYTIAVITGFFISLLYIILSTIFNTKINDINDINKLLNIPILGIINKNSFNTDLPVIDFPKSLIADNFRLIRNKINYLFLDNTKNCKIITITSLIEKEGKSFVSANLAISYANIKKKTLIINFDLRKPKIHEYFNIKNYKGFTEFLIEENAAQKDINDIIIKTDYENLYFLNSGPQPPNPTEFIEFFINTEHWEKLLKNFEFIIIDTSPIGATPDAYQIVNFSDLVIFVIRFDYTHKNVIKFINQLKNELNCKISVVINDLKFNSYFYDYLYPMTHFYGKLYYYNGYYTEVKKNKKFNIKKIITDLLNK